MSYLRQRVLNLRCGIGYAIIAIIGLVVLGGCAAGSPKLIEGTGITPAVHQIAAAPGPTESIRVSATATTTSVVALPTTSSLASPTDEATAEPTVRPTRTPKPKPTSTVRPDAPTPDDLTVSQVIERGSSGRPEIALTFDAGADRGNAEAILDTLDQYGIKASFGITGHWAEENPDLVKRMVKEGHMVFNHTWSHHSFLADSPSDPETITDPGDQKKELDRTATEISKLTHGYVVAPYFRPPYGEFDETTLETVASDGYTTTIMWSCDTLGWNGATVDEIIERCGSNPQAGDIILMHVGADSLDSDALAQMIETLEADGFDLVTVEQLLQP